MFIRPLFPRLRHSLVAMRPPVGAFSSYSSPFSSSSSRSLSSSSQPCRAAAAPGALSEEQIAIVKGSAPALAEHGVEITTRFYERLFKLHPELRSVFNSGHQATGTQQAALAAAVHAYAANIDNLGALGPAVTRIAHKHASLGVVPEQYPVVGENLLWAVKDVLGDAATPQLLDAWAVAYARLADIFIRAEADLYKEAAATPGGWNGWRKFRVDRKVRESDEIVSFYLTPQDGRALPKFKPGQYISVRVFVPELGLYQPREYSLSDAPNDKTFRISVKREFAADARPAGRVSNLLHEGLSEGSEIEVTHPYGDFTLDLDAKTPVVLISGGVGLTPLISMLSTILEQGKTRRVVFAHAARSGKVRAMEGYLADVMARNKQVSRAIFYSKVSDKDVKGVNYDYVGHMDLAKIKDKVILPDADYYVCGPLPFMDAQIKSLRNLGVPAEKIHSEVFGSTVN